MGDGDAVLEKDISRKEKVDGDEKSPSFIDKAVREREEEKGEEPELSDSGGEEEKPDVEASEVKPTAKSEADEVSEAKPETESGEAATDESARETAVEEKKGEPLFLTKEDFGNRAIPVEVGRIEDLLDIDFDDPGQFEGFINEFARKKQNNLEGIPGDDMHMTVNAVTETLLDKGRTGFKLEFGLEKHSVTRVELKKPEEGEKVNLNKDALERDFGTLREDQKFKLSQIDFRDEGALATFAKTITPIERDKFVYNINRALLRNGVDFKVDIGGVLEEREGEEKAAGKEEEVDESQETVVAEGQAEEIGEETVEDKVEVEGEEEMPEWMKSLSNLFEDEEGSGLEVTDREFLTNLTEAHGGDAAEIEREVVEVLEGDGLPNVYELGEDFDFDQVDLERLQESIQSIEDPEEREYHQRHLEELREMMEGEQAEEGEQGEEQAEEEEGGEGEEQVEEEGGVEDDQDIEEEEGSKEESVEDEVSGEHIRAMAQWAYEQGEYFARRRYYAVISEAEAEARAGEFKAELSRREEAGEEIYQKEKRSKVEKVVGLIDFTVPWKSECEPSARAITSGNQEAYEKVMKRVGGMITRQHLKNFVKRASVETLAETYDQFGKLKNEMAKSMKQSLAGVQQ